MKALQSEHKLVIDELATRQKEKDACIKKFKKLEIAQQVCDFIGRSRSCCVVAI